MPGQTQSRRDTGMTLYGVFVGVLVTVVLVIATTTAFPTPDGAQNDRYRAISLYRMVMSLGTSLVVLAAGLFLPARFDFLRLGLMLAAVANLVVGNFWAWDYENDWVRLLAATVSLVIAVGAGLIQYTRRPGAGPSTRPAAPSSAPSSDPSSDAPMPASTEIEARLRAVEQRLDTAAAALSSSEERVRRGPDV